MKDSTPPPRQAPLALVLAGGAARGAYEVGVLEYLCQDVAKALGHEVVFDIMCGTSVGAINACTMAAFADEPIGRVARLAAVWSDLKVDQVLQPTSDGMLSLFRALVGQRQLPANALFESTLLAGLLKASIPFDRIDTNLRAGLLQAITVSATQIKTGKTAVFVQRKSARDPLWPKTRHVTPTPVRLRLSHVLASAAVPLMFPAVQIDGHYYCDGGLRQNVPISPARRLGAQGVLVIHPRHASPPPAEKPGVRDQPPSSLFVLGKTLNALLLDRVENDIDRLEKINAILDAGVRRFGPTFVAELNDELGYPAGKGLCQLKTVEIRSSENIGLLSADFVSSPKFRVDGVLGRLMRTIAEGEATREADLLSYLLFDGAFAQQLMELGRSDARAKHDEICDLFEELRQRRTEDSD